MNRLLLFLFLFTTIASYGVIQLDPSPQDGHVDPDFISDANITSPVYAMAEQSDGKILVGIGVAGGGSSIIRLNTNGTEDLSFLGPISFQGFVNDILIGDDGKIIVAGGAPDFVRRLNADGSYDPTFNLTSIPNLPDSFIYEIALSEDGKVYIGGVFSTSGTQPRHGLIRVNNDGSLDTSFTTDLPAVTAIRTMDLQPDGRLLVAGQNDLGAQYRIFRRYNTDGTQDFSFNGDENYYTYDIKVQQDGKIMVSGPFNTYDGISQYGVARIESDGSLDSSFVSYNTQDPGTTYTIFDVELLENDQYLLNGSFTHYNGLARKHVVKVNSDGTIDDSFNSGSGPNELTWEVFVQNDGQILVGGNFTSYSGQPRMRIARLLNNVLSTDDQSLSASVDIYPNPVDNILTIKVSDLFLSEVQVSIYSITGQLIKSDQVTEQKELNLDFLASGVYLTKITSGNRSFSKKIIKN